MSDSRTSIANVLTLGNRGNLFKPHVEGGNGTPALPTEFVLHQNYPNPFNPVTWINYDLPEQAHVSLVVFNVLGQKVVELAEGDEAAGYHTTTWNATDQASGVCFARFVATNSTGEVKFLKVNKLVLMK